MLVFGSVDEGIGVNTHYFFSQAISLKYNLRCRGKCGAVSLTHNTIVLDQVRHELVVDSDVWIDLELDPQEITLKI